MSKRIRRSIATLISAVLVLSMAFQSLAAIKSYVKPENMAGGAAADPVKVTGTWTADAQGNWFFASPDGAAKDGWYYLNTTNKATEYNWFCFDANGVMRTGWIQDKSDPSVWYYAGETKDSSEGGMVKGWATDPRDGKRYYMDPSTGIMRYGWQLIGNVWYYFGEKQYANASHPYGAMYVNERTPDGYYVGSNGGWIQNHSENDSDDPVGPVVVPVTGVSLDKSEVTLVVGDTCTLNAAVAPASATNKNVKWSSSDSKVANVDAAGKVTAVAAGTATITVTAVDGGKTATCIVTVKPATETKTVAEILGTVSGGFPGKQNAWVADNGNICYKEVWSSDLTFEHNNLGSTLPVSSSVTKDENNYVYEGDYSKITFTMGEGKLVSITFYSSSEYTNYNGTYKAPASELKYIKDVLATVEGNFPTSASQDPPTNAWVDTNSNKCYVYNEMLNFYNAIDKGYDVSVQYGEVTKSGDNYIFEDAATKITFTMDNGKLKNIVFSDANRQYCEGTYAPPAPVTFKAVYNTKNDANTLTFYYDAVDHSGDNITVYENGADNYLFDDEKEQREKWGYWNKSNGVKSVVIDSSVANYEGLTSTAYMFANFPFAGSISGAEYLDVSNVTDMNNMFYYFGGDSSASLNVVPNVSNWDTAKVENMEQMFYSYGWDSEALDFTLDLSGWNVQSVTSYDEMFEDAGGNTDTWSVTIPAKTGEQANDATHWYVGNGSDTNKYIAPAYDRAFTVATPAPEEVKYMAWEGGQLVEKSTSEYTEVTNDTTTLGAGFYVVLGADVQTAGLVVNGTAESPTTLILADGAKLTVTAEVREAGINVASDKALVITGQKLGTGALIATGGQYCAGIGGGSNEIGGTVTINGGTVTATGGEYGAGIGGGDHRAGGTVTINGGTVTATGGDEGAGIGGGREGSGGTVTINGGTVTANGRDKGSGIGGTVTFNGGTVTANGGSEGSGITGTVTFNGSFTVMAGDEAPDEEVAQDTYASNHTQKYAHIEKAPASAMLGSSYVSTGNLIEVGDGIGSGTAEPNVMNEIPDVQAVVYDEIAVPVANEVMVIEEVTEIKEETD